MIVMRCSSLCPKEVWNFLHTYSFRSFEFPLHLFQQYHIGSFGFSINLRMHYRREMVLGSDILKEILQIIICKMDCVIQDNRLRNVLFLQSVPLEEFMKIGYCVLCQSFSFDPLDEIIYNYINKFKNIRTYGNWPKISMPHQEDDHVEFHTISLDGRGDVQLITNHNGVHIIHLI